MDYIIIQTTLFSQNCSLIWCKKTKFAVLIDPGGDPEKIKQKVLVSKVMLIKILLTHGHPDHVGAAAELAQYYSIPIVGPEKEDNFWLQDLSRKSYLFNLYDCKSLTPNYWLKEGDNVGIGNVNLRVLHCPGHTPGHIVFFEDQYRFLISGDVIFKGSIGRTDFPRGNYSQLIRSIKQRLLILGDDVTFIPGHGQISTLGHERIHNPFLQEKNMYKN